MTQFAIAALSPIAFLLLARKRRSGFIVTLASEPFWFWSATHPWQPGILAVSAFYSGVAVYGWLKWGREE